MGIPPTWMLMHSSDGEYFIFQNIYKEYGVTLHNPITQDLLNWCMDDIPHTDWKIDDKNALWIKQKHLTFFMAKFGHLVGKRPWEL